MQPDLLTADVATQRALVARGSVLALAVEHLHRLVALDQDGPRLNAVPVLDPDVLRHAAQLDAELAAGRSRGPLHGVPYTVKDSFAVAGLPCAAGSPAFARLIATRDAIVLERLRAAGALLLGRTTMPPMAIGGGQAGLHGRVVSPYNPEQLPCAWHSGSSAGSGVAVAAGFGAFGLGEETVSSGRSPASNNALVAYTPSWGVVPSTGNWPLHPYRDVVVPHTRSVRDLLAVLAAIAGPDDRDLWQRQHAVDVAPAARVSAALHPDLLDTADPAAPLRGLRIGVPRLYTGRPDPDVAPVPLRPSIAALWDRTERLLTEAGATVLPVDLPLVEAYEERSARRPTLTDLGLLDPAWTTYELGPLVTHAWSGFLAAYTDGALTLDRVSPGAVRPDPPDAVDAVESGLLHPGRDAFDWASVLRSAPPTEPEVLAHAEPALRGLVEARRRFWDDWMTERGIDVVAFPANSDIGPADADRNPASARLAWADGVVFSTTNHVLRRVGLPSVTVPIGLLDDLAMPVGLTLAGRAWDDALLIRVAGAVEHVLPARVPPPLPVVPPVAAPGTGADPNGTRPHGTEPHREDPHGARLPAGADGPADGTRLDAHALIAGDGSITVRAETRVPSAAATALLEVGGRSGPVALGADRLTLTLDAERRRRHRDVRATALLVALDADGAVLDADLAVLPFDRPDLHAVPAPGGAAGPHATAEIPHPAPDPGGVPHHPHHPEETR
ncbi:MAG TPA: amidase family protein [Cellulomonas sp.]